MSNSKKYLLDTNILVDLCSPSRSAHEQAKRVVMYLARSRHELFATVCSLKDCYYILAEHYGGSDFALICVKKLTKFVTLIAIEPGFVGMALNSDEPDFEDALIQATAEANYIDVLITRDEAGFKSASFEKVLLVDIYNSIFNGH